MMMIISLMSPLKGSPSDHLLEDLVEGDDVWMRGEPLEGLNLP